MEWKEVKQFIEENKGNEEVSGYLQGLLSVEGVQQFLQDNKEAKSWLDSTVDKRTSKSLETWKANHLEALINEEVKRRFPEKDAKDIELEKLKSEVEKMQREKQREILTNQAIKIASDKKLPLPLVDFFIGADEETTNANLEVLESVFQSSVQSIVEQRLKGDGYNPPRENHKGTLTLDSLKGMSQAEINQNWDSVKQLLKQ
ncbi:DUF4355 domain-containing protein [Fredinandcohnia humi]